MEPSLRCQDSLAGADPGTTRYTRLSQRSQDLLECFPRRVCVKAPDGQTKPVPTVKHEAAMRNTETDPTKNPRLPLLLVDDEPAFLESCSFTLQAAGFENIVTIQDSREVLSFLESQEVEVIVLDLTMPHVAGEEILAQLAQEYPEIPTIVLTGIDEIEVAVRCVRAGAVDYVVKPVEPSAYVAGVRQAAEGRALRREVGALRDSLLSGKLNEPQAFSEIITADRGMHSIFQYVEMVAPTTRPLMIIGETGVGKELIARSVHTLSRRTGKFISINVAGLDDTLFSDTLFGHEKGAFTGAVHKRLGLIEQAAGGTLFLDEIGDMEMPTQIKMLRLLQEAEYYPLGSDIPRKTDARVIVATHRDLSQLLRAGRFRKDLFYRLSTHRVQIPPLRKRKNDVPPLLERFLAEAAATLGKKKPTPPPELFALLSTYEFPGNVRELQSMAFDAVTRHKGGTLSTRSFREVISEGRERDAFELEADGEGVSLGAGGFSWSKEGPLPTLKKVEQSLIAEAMRRAGGNQSIAAELLGMSRGTLHRRLRKDDA